MIIYHAVPTKVYPLIGTYLAKKHPTEIVNSYNFNDIWTIPEITPIKQAICLASLTTRYPSDFTIPRSYREIFSKHNIQNITINEVIDAKKELRLKDRKIDFIQGIFSSSRFNDFKKEDNDFSFTFIDHPIDSIYRFFYYLTNKKIKSDMDQFVKDTNNTFFDKITQQKNFLSYNGKEWHYSYFLHSCDFSIKKYIDNVIENNAKITSNLFNFPVVMSPELLGRTSFMFKEHDFYGISNNKETIIKSLTLLNKKFKAKNFKIDIDINDVVESYFNSDYSNLDISYRKKDLEVLLKEDILIYEEKLRYINENW